MRRNVILLCVLLAVSLMCSICTAVLMTLGTGVALSVVLAVLFCVLPACGCLLGFIFLAGKDEDDEPVRKVKRKRPAKKVGEFEGRFVDDEEAESIIRQHRMNNSAVYDKKRLDDAFDKLRSSYVRRDA